MIAYFDRFSIVLTKDQASSASHPGECDADVAALLKLPNIKRQLKKISDTDLTEELREYGAWSDEELKSRVDNESRIIWIAAGNIIEELRESRRTS